MKYKHVFINAITYILPEEKVSTRSLEEQLSDVYRELGIPLGQLESLSKIHERRYWPKNHRLCDHAALAAEKALKQSGMSAQDIDMLVYAGVGRDQLEPATACAVAHRLKVSPRARIYDISNACLGVLNGIIQIADAIELGQIQSGIVVSAESAREIIDTMITEIKKHCNLDHLMRSLATLTGGSGATAVILTRNSNPQAPQLLGGTIQQATEWHQLCLWGAETSYGGHLTMQTDAAAVLKQGMALAKKTYDDFLHLGPWPGKPPDKFICHQVAKANQEAIRKALNIPEGKDFSTYQTLANTGTVALPMTAAIAAEAQFLLPGDRVAFFGIGSGLNCIMLGVQW